MRALENFYNALNYHVRLYNRPNNTTWIYDAFDAMDEEGIETTCQLLVKPENPISQQITAITGITNEMREYVFDSFEKFLVKYS